jgi:hypothetical protein
MFRETARSRGLGEIAATSLYTAFEHEASHDLIQRAIRYLVDRDFIAPHSFSLTAKGMAKRVDSRTEAQANV